MSSIHGVAQMLATLSIACAISDGAMANGANPILLGQILVPAIAKEDWQRSAFSDDGALLFVVAAQRSFVVHTQTGRELRRIALAASEEL